MYFRVPLSSSIGDQTVKATQGSNSASKTFTVTALVSPIIFLDPDSGPVGTSVDISGAGFAPSSTITIEFDGKPVTTSPSPVISSAGIFTATFNVLQSSNGDHKVEATDGSKSASKTFTVGSVITLNPTSGPLGTPVDITGTGFSPNSTVTITFGGDTLPESPVTTNNSGGFSATFAVPESSSGPQIVKAAQGSNSASKTFTVTPLSSLVATSRSNVSSFGVPNNQSNATLLPPSGNQSNATIPLVTNNTFDALESNGTVAIENKVPSANASSTTETENSSTAPTVKQMNDTSVIASTDNTINNNPPLLLLPKVMTLQIARKVQKRVFPLVLLRQMINVHLRP